MTLKLILKLLENSHLLCNKIFFTPTFLILLLLSNEVQYHKTLLITSQNSIKTDTMKILLAIGLGSFIGGILRYLLSQFIQTKATSIFPVGTLSVNIIGCFVIGVVFALVDKGTITKTWQLFLATGILGGFTTYSAFSNESFGLLREGHYWYAIAYISASILLGLLATFLGYFVPKFI